MEQTIIDTNIQFMKSLNYYNDNELINFINRNKYGELYNKCNIQLSDIKQIKLKNKEIIETDPPYVNINIITKNNNISINTDY